MFGESSAIYPYAVIHLLVPTMLRWNIVSTKLSEFELAPKKSQFLPAPRNMNIWKVFAPRVNFQRWKKKTHIAYSIIPVSAGSILSCNIVAVRLVHTVWIAMNDRFGEGKWPVVASYDNIYALSHTLYVRPKECRGNISILSLSLPPFPSLYIKIIVYFPSSIPIYY